MKRFLNRLASLLLCLTLCIVTVVPLTGAANGETLITVQISDAANTGTFTVKAVMASGITEPPTEAIVDSHATDTSDEAALDSDGADMPTEAKDGGMADLAGEQSENTLFDAMLAEAEKYLGFPYVWAGTDPSTGFDCSGFVSWVLNHAGWDVGRLGAQALYSICDPVSQSDIQLGDLVFFTKTYRTSRPVTHVGIYTGDGMMIHCGSSTGVTYAKLSGSYWRQHYYGAGRLPLEYLSDGGKPNA